MAAEQNTFENDFVIMQIEDGILHLKYKKSLYDLECARNVVESRLVFCQGNTYPLYVDISNIKTQTKEARIYSSKGDAEKYVSATALWGTSKLTEVMANFFLTVNKPAVPIKFFTDTNKALEWLHKFVKH